MIKKTEELLFECRKLKKKDKIKSVWTHKGEVYVKEEENSQATLIEDKEHLKDFISFLRIEEEEVDEQGKTPRPLRAKKSMTTEAHKEGQGSRLTGNVKSNVENKH